MEDNHEGNLFALAPRALVNFVMFSQNAPYPAYADGFESPADEEQREGKEEERVGVGEAKAEGEEEEALEEGNEILHLVRSCF